MKILAIETSCDETGLSILEVKESKNKLSFKVLATTLASQIKIHREYGGVYPMLAKREHIKHLPILLEKVLKKSKLGGSVAKSTWRPNRQVNTVSPVDLIVVTSGPGLEPALWTGIVFAKELSQKWNVPLIPVNHMEGHILSPFGANAGDFEIPLTENKDSSISFPILSLLVSGGHTELVLIKDWGKYKVIGQTVDDAAGEAYDKVARMLDLPYPGGPEISKLAEARRKFLLFENIAQADEPSIAIRQQANMSVFKKQKLPIVIKLPRPMIYSKDFNFSFSGLKTAVLYLIRDLKIANPNVMENQNTKNDIALEFENAVVETLVHKTKKAILKYKTKNLIIAGGVSANKHLKNEINKMLKKLDFETQVFFPKKELTGDNSIMIAMAGFLKYTKNKTKIYKNIKAEGNLKLK
ncbi:MAG: tRNA (adenosine(37)-N6)-threonylcarbamoyltransferase complex transferase subunit TsaD [Candidatus Paceibacterota bacterium]